MRTHQPKLEEKRGSTTRQTFRSATAPISNSRHGSHSSAFTHEIQISCERVRHIGSFLRRRILGTPRKFRGSRIFVTPRRSKIELNEGDFRPEQLVSEKYVVDVHDFMRKISIGFPSSSVTGNLGPESRTFPASSFEGQPPSSPGFVPPPVSSRSNEQKSEARLSSRKCVCSQMQARTATRNPALLKSPHAHNRRGAYGRKHRNAVSQ